MIWAISRRRLASVWDLFCRPRLWKPLCDDLLASNGDSSIGDGESQGRRFHVDLSSELSRCPYLLWTYLFLESLICIVVVLITSHSGDGLKETRCFQSQLLVVTMMAKNCPTYNQMMLPISLVSICAFLSHQIHYWIPVMCYRTQNHSTAPHHGTLSMKGL
jgi:hypothetical protein